MAEYRSQEGFPGEPVHRAAGLRDDAGSAGDSAQERDLPDSLAPPAASQEAPILENVELACGDRIVGILYRSNTRLGG